MKGILLFVLALLAAGGIWAQPVYELTDKKNIGFAGSVKNYDGIIIDSLRFDIYYPTGATSNKKYPVFFGLHGGSFTTATKTSMTEFSDEMADYGFIIIAPDYRVGYYKNPIPCVDPQDSVNLQEAIYRAMQDVNACMRYVANNANMLNVDTSWMFVGGISSGGTLALNLSYITDSLASVYYPNTVANWGTLHNVGNTLPYNYKIKGICPMWGGMPYWDSLINTQSAIPTILFKGGKDVNLPNGVGYYMRCENNSVVRSGVGIYDAMVAAGSPCVFHFNRYAPHSAYDNHFCIETTACFFNALMKGAPYSGYYENYNTSCH